MTSSFTRILFLAVFTFICGAACAQVRFSATASPQQAGIDDYITLRFTAENAHGVDRMNLPNLNDFKIISGPMQESGMSNINGAVSQYVAVSYVIQPRHKGRISISPGTATIAGKPYRSNALTITVSNVSSGNNNQQSQMMQNPLAGLDPFEDQQPATTEFKDYVLKPGENIQDKVSKNMQLRVETDKTTVYEGQPILATYKLYTRLKSESSLSKNPSFNGFSVIDLLQPDNNSYTKETLNGKEYNVYTIRKAQLYPLQAGTATLDAATLDNKISFIKYSGTNQSGAYNIDPNSMITENVSLSSKPVTITVKPLPDAGKPASFKGSVGTFRMESSLEKNSFTTDETGKLIITIGGAGNMQLMTAPDVQWPKEIEAFEAKTTDNIDKTIVPLAGSKTFEIPFAVQTPGTYKIPAVQYSYFDPAAGVYKTLSTPEISFTVTKGTGNHAAAYLNSNKKDDSLLNKIFSRRWLLILIVAGFIIIAMMIWLLKDKKKEQAEEEIKIPETITPADPIEAAVSTSQLNPLAKTEECLLQQECVEFYAVLNNELKTYFSHKLNMDAALVNARTLSAAMDKAGIDNETGLLAQQLMRDIEWQLYTPFEQNEMLNEMYARAQTIIQMMNVQRS